MTHFREQLAFLWRMRLERLNTASTILYVEIYFHRYEHRSCSKYGTLKTETYVKTKTKDVNMHFQARQEETKAFILE